MKRILLSLIFLFGSIAAASATCTPPAVMKDNASTTFNMSMVTAADGNCGSSITVQSGGIASGAIASGAIASGAVASGAYSSGAFASGAYASGSIGSGAMVDLGAIADAASTAGGTGSLSAKLRLMTTQLGTINTTLNSPMQNSGGSVTANLGTIAGVSTKANQDTNSATTTHTCSTGGFSELGCLGQIDDDIKGSLAAGTNTIGNVGSDPSSGKGTPTSVAINVSTATTTQLVAISGTTKIYVTSFDVIAGGTGNITFEYGTGASCGTGTTALTGAYNLVAQAGISKGNGVGAVLVVPAGNALCVLTSAAVQMSGSVSFQQF